MLQKHVAVTWAWVLKLDFSKHEVLPDSACCLMTTEIEGAEADALDAKLLWVGKGP